MQKYHEDALVIRYRAEDGSIRSRGKRVGASCPLTPEERRIYVREGAIAATKAVWNRVRSLREAWTLLKGARGYEHGSYWRG